MRTCAALALCLCLLFLTAASAEIPVEDLLAEGILVDDGWEYVGDLTGGVTFAIPKGMTSWSLSSRDKAAGIVLLMSNEDITVQLRRFEPGQMTYEDFTARMREEPTAEITVSERGGVEFFCYQNTRPSVSSELAGIVAVGLDGCVYKISVFTGDSERLDDEAAVWDITEVVMQTARVRDFAEWGIEAGE